MKRQHLRTRADDTICVAQTGSVNGGMCRSSVKGKMSSWNTMFQLLQHANEAAWIRLREPSKSLSKRLWTGDISAILFTNFGVAASEICLKMGVSFLRMMTQLNLRLRRECCRYVVGLFNKQKLVVLLVVSVFQTFLDLIFTVFGDFFFQWLLTSIPFWLKTQDQSFSHCYIMDTAYFSSPGPRLHWHRSLSLNPGSLESRNYQYKNDFQHL